MRLAFHHDPRYRDLWAHLALTYRIAEVYEIGCPPEIAGPWTPVESFDDVVPGRRIFFSPPDAKYSPGRVSLREYSELLYDDDVLCFGSDEQHNRFHLDLEDQLVFISTPHRTPLHAVQAALLVLDRLTNG